MKMPAAEGTSNGRSGVRAWLGRSRAIERGDELGLDRPSVLLATVLATAVDLVCTPLAYVSAWLDSSAGWLIDAGLAPLAALLCIPYFGRAVQWLWAVVLTALWGVIHLPDGVGALLGILPEKRLRVLVLLPDGEKAAQAPELIQGLRVAAQIFRREANVRLMAAVAGQFEGAFAPAPNPDAGWLRNQLGQPTMRSVGCRGQAIKEDLGPAGAGFGWAALRSHPFGITRRLLGLGAPVLAMTVDLVQQGQLAGCSLGPLTDYITIAVGQPICLAHELGHACNLVHRMEQDNLMFPTCGGTHLTRGQVAMLRLSRHVSYL